jgi:hypothetical protein
MRPHAKLEEINHLFRQSLAPGYDGEKPWSAVRRLHRMGLRIVFTKAARSTPLLFAAESFALLSHMLELEQNELTLMSIIFGLGHLDIETAVPLVIPFANHPNEDVRFATTCALGQFPQNPQAIEALQMLASDKDKDCRNWALFAIGTQSDLDTPELRETLAHHVNDPYSEAREEAIAGLAKRKDGRAVLPFFRLLRSGSYHCHHESDYETLLEAQASDGDWTIDDMLDTLYARFSHLLPARAPTDPIHPQH